MSPAAYGTSFKYSIYMIKAVTLGTHTCPYVIRKWPVNTHSQALPFSWICQETEKFRTKLTSSILRLFFARRTIQYYRISIFSLGFWCFHLSYVVQFCLSILGYILPEVKLCLCTSSLYLLFLLVEISYNSFLYHFGHWYLLRLNLRISLLLT